MLKFHSLSFFFLQKFKAFFSESFGCFGSKIPIYSDHYNFEILRDAIGVHAFCDRHEKKTGGHKTFIGSFVSNWLLLEIALKNCTGRSPFWLSRRNPCAWCSVERRVCSDGSDPHNNCSSKMRSNANNHNEFSIDGFGFLFCDPLIELQQEGHWSIAKAWNCAMAVIWTKKRGAKTMWIKG